MPKHKASTPPSHFTALIRHGVRNHQVIMVGLVTTLSVTNTDYQANPRKYYHYSWIKVYDINPEGIPTLVESYNQMPSQESCIAAYTHWCNGGSINSHNELYNGR